MYSFPVFFLGSVQADASRVPQCRSGLGPVGPAHHASSQVNDIGLRGLGRE